MKHEALDILRTFSREEFKRFQLFVACPYFTKKKNLTKFLKFHFKFHPSYEDKELTDEYLKSKMDNISCSALRNYYSDLTILLIDFLQYLANDKVAIPQYIHLLEEIENRDLMKIYGKKRNDFLNLINDEKSEFQTTDYIYLNQFYLLEKNLFVKNLLSVKKGTHAKLIELENLTGSTLTTFYLLESLKDWIQSKTQIYYYNLETRQDSKLVTFFEEGEQVERIFEKSIRQESNSNRKKILRIYFLIYLCFKENQSIESLCLNLENLLKAIKSIPENINAFEFQWIISISRNAVAGLQRRDYYDANLKNEFDEIYLKSFVQTGGDLTIPDHTFSEIFLGALINDQLAFAQKIFVKYRKFTNKRMHMFYEHALRFFESLKQRDFTAASSFFLNLKSTDIDVKRKLKFLQVYMHYEIGDFDYCISLLNNLRKFICNHSSEHSKLMLDHLILLCNSFKLLCEIRLKFDKDKLVELMKTNKFSINAFVQNKKRELLNEYAGCLKLRPGQLKKNFL